MKVGIDRINARNRRMTMMCAKIINFVNTDPVISEIIFYHNKINCDKCEYLFRLMFPLV